MPFGAGASLSGRLLNADGAGLAGRSLRVVSRPSRGALGGHQVETVGTGAHGGFALALAGGSLAADRGRLPRRGRPGRGPTPGPALRVRGALSSGRAPSGLRTGQAVRFWGRVRARGAPLPRRGKLVAIQYYERRVEALAPGPRHPQRPRRPLPRPLPVPLHQRLGADPPARHSPRRGALALRARRPPRTVTPMGKASHRLGRVGWAAMSEATLHTSAGAIVLELHDYDAPKTVENFRKLAADGFYDGLIFHRVIRGS